MAFNRDRKSGGGRSFGRSFGGDRGRDRQLFDATCSNCNKECKVPFRPTGGKPVYCSDCFRTMGGSDSRRTDDRSFRKPNFDNRDRVPTSQPQYKEQFEVLNAKLDKILKLLNPEKSIEKPKIVLVPQAVDVENVEPIKKKTKTKKIIPTEETPIQTDISSETSE